MSYNILAFCGGGIRGLASVTMLNELVTNYPNVVTGANMLAGTSTGAGIVAALANGQTPSDLITYFNGPEVDFYNDKCFNPGSVNTLPQYNVASFASGMAKKYKTQTLAQIKSELNFDVLMTSFCIGDDASNVAWQPVLFHNLPASTNAGTFVSDAVVASGAMQGMFGAQTITVGTTPQYYVDGAFVHHDPSLAAIALAVQSGVALTDIALICFGTGFMMNALGVAAAAWGPLQWQQGDDQNPYDLSSLLINGTVSPITSISLNGTSTSLIPQLAGMMLGNRYAYLNPTLGYYIPENDTNSQDLSYLETQSEAVDYSTAQQVLQNNWPALTIGAS